MKKITLPLFLMMFVLNIVGQFNFLENTIWRHEIQVKKSCVKDKVLGTDDESYVLQRRGVTKWRSNLP